MLRRQNVTDLMSKQGLIFQKKRPITHSFICFHFLCGEKLSYYWWWKPFDQQRCYTLNQIFVRVGSSVSYHKFPQAQLRSLWCHTDVNPSRGIRVISQLVCYTMWLSQWINSGSALITWIIMFIKLKCAWAWSQYPIKPLFTRALHSPFFVLF